MKNFLWEYGKLNSDGRFFVDCALKGALSNPACLKSTPKKKKKKSCESSKKKRASSILGKWKRNATL